MIRIIIEWDFVSPLLQTIKGIVTVSDYDNVELKNNILFKCKVTKKSGIFSLEGLNKNDNLYTQYKAFYSRIKVMAESYYNGMLLKDTQFQWIDHYPHDNVNDWVKEKLNSQQYDFL